MGQKVNPHGLRVGVIKDWNAKWFANNKDFADCLIEDYGFTCFNEPTKTCLALGPCYPEDLIELTKKLQLYKD